MKDSKIHPPATPPFARRIVAVLGGATASGKTCLAVEWAQRAGLEILSCDSRQIYAGMAVGTAAPGPKERKQVFHHLVGTLDPREELSVVAFLGMVEAVLRTPGPDLLAVGGTGQFLTALRQGVEAGPPPDSALREELATRLQSEGPQALHSWLLTMDPAPPHDALRNPVRLLRALEKAILRQRGVHGVSCPALAPTAQTLALEIPRDELHRRIEVRLDRMLEDGWLAEIRALAQAGIAPDTPGCSAIGYRPLWPCALEGKPVSGILRQELIAATRQYAKRQETWLRQKLSPRWLAVEEIRRLLAA